jgi:SAM-dependent methyltransferase
MIHYFYTIITSKNPNIIFLKVLITLFIIYIGYLLIYKSKRRCSRQEGFTQNEKFILKTEDNIYDDFYSDIHDKIHLPDQRIGYELTKVIKMTEPTTQNSVFLDIGSGTGSQVNELKQAGYKAYGIDRSSSMVEKSTKNYPKCHFKCGNVMEPMVFEKGTFTHILCTYFTIYHFKDKKTLFHNCYSWLMPNGYLILHLVEPTRYDAIVPIAKVGFQLNPLNPYKNPHEFESSRITDSIVEFPDFQYKAEYDFSDKHGKCNKEVKVRETFKDNKSGNIRQNERTMYMESIENILSMASHIGFNVKGYVDMKKSEIEDENQYLYVLEKI